MFYGKRILLGFLILGLFAASVFGQAPRPKKVYMETDMEGVSGIFDTNLQCMPGQSPRFEESRKLLTGEINAAVDGLFAGGATEVIVDDGHDGGQTLSVLDINPKCRLIQGRPVPRVFDSTFCAMVFIGQHPMAGARNGILSHTYDSLNTQNLWINGKPVGELGSTALVAGEFGIPVIMVSGDTAVCKELYEFAPQAECAEVKSGLSRTSGIMLPHPVACKLIYEKAKLAMEHLSEMKPYKIEGPVEIRDENTTRGTNRWSEGNGVHRVDERTWVFQGKDFMDAWRKYERE
jgi:D-amino peptidase